MYALAKPSKDSSYNTSNSQARIQLPLYVNCLLSLSFQVTAHFNCTSTPPSLHLPHTTTVNREIFVVKIFLDSMASPKIKRTKIMRIINDNAVRGRLSENYLTQKFIAQNICDAKYS